MSQASPDDRETDASQGDDASGDVRFPGLRVEARLGAGGSGIVYRAWDIAARRHVALKVLRGRGSEAQRARFRREVETHRRLADPGVVRIFADGTTPDGAPWFTMELVDGPSLQDLVDRAALPPRATAVAWIRDLARTLARLHARGVVHRDVKPSNILLQDGVEARLADFGVALVADEERLTVGPRAIGTPRFMAPEQLAGAVGDWTLVDVYALGLVLGELLGPGRPPADLAYVVRRATAELPADRYPGAAALADDLERWLAGRAVRMRASAFVWRLRRTAPTTALRVIAVTLVVVFSAAFIVVRARTAQRDARAEADWEIARAGLERTWSAGDLRAAFEWVDRFTSDPARQRTPTAGRAWLELAALHRDAARPGDAADALGRALAATDDVAVRSAAIAEVVADHRRARRWPALAHLLQALPAEGIDLDPAVRREAAAELALAEGDVAAAAALLPERAALLAPLQALRSVPLGTVGALDSDGDGVLELVIGEPGDHPPIRERDEHGELRWRFGSGPEHGFRDEGGRGLLQASTGLWSLAGDGAVRLGPPSGFSTRVGGRVFAATTAARRTLSELSGGGAAPADPATEVLSAYVQGTATGDVDGDGQSDLVVTFGPSSGFLVRAFRVDPGGGPPVALASVRPGDVGDVRVVATPAGPRIVALIIRGNPSALLFGAAEPFGAPCGIRTWRYVAEPGGGRLEPVAAYDLPPGPCFISDLEVADLDGDGTAEVLATRRGQPEPTLLVLRHQDDVLSPAFALSGYHATSVARLPGRDVLLLTRMSRPNAVYARWLVGAGTETLPRRTWDLDPIDPGADPTVRLFAACSLDRRAAESAAQRGDTALAARFWERAGEPVQAARALAESARGPGAVEALAHAVDLAIDGADATLARSLVDHLTALAPDLGAEKGAQLAAHLEPAWSLDLGRPFSREVQVVVPPALRHDLPNRELTVRAPAGVGTILRVPLRATGGPAWLHAAGVWTRAEWGCVVEVAIVRPDGRELPLRFRFGGNGAGGVLFRGIERLTRVQVARPDVASPFDLRVSTLRDGAGLRLTNSAAGELDVATVGGSVPQAGEPWELVLGGLPGLGSPPGPLCELVLRRLEFGGFTVDPGPAAPTPAAVAWIAGEAPPPPGEPEGDPLLVALLRLDPSLQDRVRDFHGPDAADRLFHAAWDSAARQHRGDGRTIDATLGMGDLAGVAPPQRLWLQVARGEALLRSGRPAAARTALEAVWSDAATVGQDAWREAFEAAALLAELDLSVGDAAGVAAWMTRAAAVAPDAEVGARMLRNRPRLADAPVPAARTGP